jgi:cytochrome P450
MSSLPTDPMPSNGVVGTAEPDPFEAFNRAQGAGTVRNPYPRFAELRRRAPVITVDVRELLGNAGFDGFAELGEGVEGLEIYCAVSHDAVSEVLRDSTRFTSNGYAMTIGTVMGRTILEMDPPEHTLYRGLLKQAFTKQALEHWEHELVRPTTDALIDRFLGRGRADLVRELTFPFPVQVIAGMMGLPEEDQGNFHRWAVELISVTTNYRGALDASAKLRGLFARVLERRRAEPRDDLVSLLALAELDGERLDDEAIFNFLCLLAPAGAETTYRSSSNLLCGLLTHPAQLDAVRADRSLIPQAIEEGLRWECPLTQIMRMSTCDTTVCGVEIPAGAIVNVNVAAANHDETRYERAEEFDIFRPPSQHLAFAFGTHACLGTHLARMETRVLLEALFDRLQGMRLAPDAGDVHVTGLTFRAPLTLPVVFDEN